MSTPIPYPLVNGTRHQFSSIELKINNQIYVGFKSINYSRTRTRTKVRGNHEDPIAKTQGENDYTADCEMYVAEYNLMQSLLGDGYGDVFFEILVTYTQNGFDTIQDVIQGCTLDSTEAGGSQGPDPLVRKIELNPLKILFNGTDDLTVPLTGVPT